MKKSDEFPPQATPDAEPQVMAIKRQDELWRMGKRTFLKSTVAGALASVAAACAGEDKNAANDTAKTDTADTDNPPPNPNPDNDPIPPFGSGGTTYRLIALPDYNAQLPATGRNMAIVASVKDDDFYFRYFDDQGTMAVNQHESQAADTTALADMKTLAQTVTAKGSADATEQARFAELFATTTGTATGSGRRIQGTEARVDSAGRRVQGSLSSGTISGRRIQGGEGRPGTGKPRNLGTLVVNNQKYDDSKVAETYTDGYTRIVHSGGEAVIRTDALPEIVRMQLPLASVSSSSRPSAIPTATTVTEAEPSSQSSDEDTTYRSYGSHYWRPN